MKTAYLLPCSCGRDLEVDAGQAGSDVVCQCGSTVAVPTIRQLKQLKQAQLQPASTAPKKAAWTPTHGIVFSLGIVVAIAALIFSSYNGVIFWMTTRVNDPVALIVQDLETEVDSWTAEAALGFFRDEEAAGLGTPYPPGWAQIDEMHETARQRVIGGLIAAGVGMLAAGAALAFSKPK